MSDKNTLIIDKPNTEINDSTEIKKSVAEENYKLKLALKTLLI